MNRILVIALVCLAPALYGQMYRDDAQLRTHLNLEMRLSRHFSAHLDQQYRFNENMTNFRRASADMALEWRMNKHVRVLADYKFVYRKSDKEFWQQRNWYGLALVLRNDVKRWRFIYRNLLQFRGGTVNSAEQNNFRIYDRNKLTVRYEFTKRYTGYTSMEAYVPLNNPQMMGVERTRNQLGMLISTRKNQQLELYFMYQVFWQKGNWWDQSDKYPSPYNRRDYIYGVAYNIQF
jgi:hypothetical protein